MHRFSFGPFHVVSNHKRDEEIDGVNLDGPLISTNVSGMAVNDLFLMSNSRLSSPVRYFTRVGNVHRPRSLKLNLQLFGINHHNIKMLSF